MSNSHRWFYLSQILESFIILIGEMYSNCVVSVWWLQVVGIIYSNQKLVDLLHLMFSCRWIGRSGTIVWPPCSPDLNSPDFYLWDHLGSLVYHVQWIMLKLSEINLWQVFRQYTTCHKFDIVFRWQWNAKSNPILSLKRRPNSKICIGLGRNKYMVMGPMTKNDCAGK